MNNFSTRKKNGIYEQGETLSIIQRRIRINGMNIFNNLPANIKHINDRKINYERTNQFFA